MSDNKLLAGFSLFVMFGVPIMLVVMFAGCLQSRASNAQTSIEWQGFEVQDVVVNLMDLELIMHPLKEFTMLLKLYQPKVVYRCQYSELHETVFYFRTEKGEVHATTGC